MNDCANTLPARGFQRPAPSLNTSEQLELFGDYQPLIALPPCGRGRGKCLAVYELGDAGPQLRCTKCGGVAPIQFLPRQDRRRTISVSPRRRLYD